MKLAALQWVICQWAKYQYLQHIKRVGDNLFALQLDKDSYYIDLTRGRSTIFVAPTFLATKTYQAPFDLTLAKLCNRAKIEKIEGDGQNRILRLHLSQKGSYKHARYTLQFECTGRNTNAILLRDNLVIDALRHIKHSCRPVKIGAPLAPLPQPTQALRESPLPNMEFMEFLQYNYAQITQQQLCNAQNNAMAQMDKKIAKVQDLIDTLQDSKELAAKAAELQAHAKLLLAQLHTLQPPIRHELSLVDFSGLAHRLQIPEDAQSYSHAAQILFAQAKKLTQRAQNTHIQAEFLASKLDFLQRQKALVSTATNLADIAIYTQQHTQKRKKKKEDYESFFVCGVKISFGKNQQENIALLHDARANDIWLHIRDIPSSHMILRSFNKNIALPILQKAAEILVGFAKTQAGNYEVDWTQRKFVKMTDGACVQYAKYQTLVVKKEN
ncbi:MAG: NFACT family protein [Helicobacter sp.]|nr:NFACT family protein [Helicobacter sp.]